MHLKPKCLGKSANDQFKHVLYWLRDANIIRYCRAVTTPQFPLRAYEDESKFRVIEIEFLIEKSAQIVPVEVKAKRGSTASLNTVLERDDVPIGYKLSASNIGVSGKIITVLLYMAPYLVP